MKEYLKLSTDIVNEQLKNGRDEAKVYKEAYESAKDKLECERLLKIIDINAKISKGIKGLSQADDWSNLIKVAQHALGEAVTAVSNDKKIGKLNFSNSLKFQHFILTSGKADFLKYLTDEAKEKFHLDENKY